MGTNGLTALGQQYMGVDGSRSFAIDRSGIYATQYVSQQGGSTGQISSQEQDELTTSLTGTGTYAQPQLVGGSSYAPYSPYGVGTGNVNRLVDTFYDATYCFCTDDENFEAALDGINKDNVMEVMKTWNKYHSKEKGESFMEAFMWDADSSQKEKYGKQIARALRDRAEAAGVYDEEMAEAFAKIDNEMRSWFWISNDVSEMYDKIIYRIAEAEADKLAANEQDPDKKAEIREKAMEYAEPYKAYDD